jgi:formate hydrogenlyase transcriptional activator
MSDNRTGFTPAQFGAENRIIGDSVKLRQVWEAVNVVAPTDAAVLICGETGTGKEMIARMIHELSSRNRGPYVKVNCGAIPAGLIESELFGHERGAFTGAFAQAVGRFQTADQGTIFLDEIGDLPIELQPKLLRVLQEQEFERLGASRTIRVKRRFREDLLYRINVFPISLPPLRDRHQDIPALVWHFVRKFSAKSNKDISVVPEDVMDILQRHAWPGNIRELQNFIERAVILSPGPVLRPPMSDLKPLVDHRMPSTVRTLAEAERCHILDALEQSGWVVAGRRGAAVRLGLPRTTLMARMSKLGIGVKRVSVGA